jgi:hypothetical protein
VPSDSKIFFNDVMKGGITPQVLDKNEADQESEADDDDSDNNQSSRTASQTTVQPAMPARRAEVRRR